MNTNFFTELVAGNVFQTKTSPAIPTEFYIGLSTTSPTVTGSGVNEPSGSTGGGYTRVKLTSLAAPAPTTGGHVVTNGADISWPESTTDWGTITSYVIFDSLTGGNLLMFGDLTTSRSVEANTIMTIKAGYLKLSALNPS